MLDPAFCLYATEMDTKNRLIDLLEECAIQYNGEIPDGYIKEIESLCRQLGINPNCVINYND